MNKKATIPSCGIQWIYRMGILFGVLLFSGCISGHDEHFIGEWVSPSPDQVWSPPSETASQEAFTQKKTDIPDELMKPGAQWRLADIIEVALQNNPDTKSAWYEARSAAAEFLSAKGDYYPQITGSASVSHTASSGGSSTSAASFDPAVQLSWLIFDMGGRSASVDEKYRTLLAADFEHNAVIQDSVFQVIQSYFQYSNAKAVKKAYETSLKDAAANLEAAKQRHDNGLATIADVLQLKTAFSQAQVNLDTIEGKVQTIRGALATAMGLPANTSYDIEDLPINPSVESITDTVDSYIEKAQANRPDLAAQRSRVESSLAHVRAARSDRYPSISFSNTLGTGINNETSEWENQNRAMVTVSIPIFHGYSLRYNQFKAEEDAKKQTATLDKLEQTVIYEVWSSYFALKAAAQTVKSNADLMESAQQSYEVALGRYKEGVGGYLELLSAQSALESARSQQVTAMADFYISLAQLSKNTGLLWQQPETDQDRALDLFPDATVTK